MKQITVAAAHSFDNYQPFSRDNTKVEIHAGTANLYLFGNKIAFKDKRGNLSISNAGWQTNTTKERLNALPNVSICQRKGVWYLNGEQWDGDWILVNERQAEQPPQRKIKQGQLSLF